MIRAILAFFFLLLLLDTASAKTKRFLPKAFDASFIQEKKYVSRNKTKTSSNQLKIKYQFPSNIRLEEISDGSILYICNKKNVWIYTPPFMKGEPGDLKIGSSSKYCYSKIFDSLNKGLVNNKLYKVKELKNNSVNIAFEPKAKNQLGVSKLVLVFNSKKRTFNNVSQLKMYYIGESYPVILKKQRLNVVKKFPSSTFKFTPPKNTDIQRMK